jgi:serine/threonine protein kinase/WD40 repeat protein
MESLAEDDPSSIGGYELRARLGVGGFGVVYLGLSPGGRAVAVKVPRSELARDADFLRRFRQEVMAARQVNGLFTAPVVAAGIDDRPPWVATAYVPGPSLGQLVAEHGPLPQDALWRLLAGLVEALQAIHGCGLVHRDLKPANVLMAADGPRVIDFGISKAVDGSALTTAGMVIGTAGFMSPEQAQGTGIGPATDVFALGCVLAFAATGHPPFGVGDAPAILYRVVHGEPALDQVPPPLLGVITRCLAKDPASRPSLTALAGIGRDGPGNGPALSPASFWPPLVAKVIRGYQDRLDTPGPGQVPVAARPAPGPPPPPRPSMVRPQTQLRQAPLSQGPPMPLRRAPLPQAPLPQGRLPQGPLNQAPLPQAPLSRTTPARTPDPDLGTRGLGRRRPARRGPGRAVIIGSVAVLLALVAGVAVGLGIKKQPAYTTVSGPSGEPPNSVAVSPDGKLLAGGYGQGHLTSLVGNTYLWNVATGRQVAEIPAPSGPVNAVQAVAFSPDGRRLAVGYGSVSGTTGVTCIWTILLGKCTRTLGEAGPTAFGSGGRLLAIGSGNTTYIWSMLTGRLVKTVPGGAAVAFSADGLLLATGDNSGAVYVWNVLTWSRQAEAILPPRTLVRSVALSPDGAYAAAAYQDGSTYLWPAKDSVTAPSGTASWQQVDARPGIDPNGAVSVIFSPNGKELLTGESNGTLTVRAVPGLRTIATLAVPGTETNAVALSSNGLTLAASPNAGPVYVWPEKTSHM